MHATRRAAQYNAAGALGLGERDQIYIMTPTNAVSTFVIREGGVGGVTRLTINLPANGPSLQIQCPVAIANPYLLTITAGALLTVLE